MIVYIAGPMTGLPDCNYPAFHEAAAALRALGYTVINPAESFDGRTDLPRITYLRRAVTDVARADALAILPGWETSNGARLEVEIARQIGLPTKPVIRFLHDE